MFFKKKQQTQQIDPTNVPQHIGIIMDGNGRWASRRGLPRSAGHRMGAEVLKKIVKYCDKVGVKSVTAYAFSTENWNRPKSEVDSLMDLFFNYLLQVEEQFGGTNVQFKIIGDRSPLSDKINDAIDYAENYTKDNTGLFFNVAVNYGGRQEILKIAREAAEKVAKGELSPSDITEDYFSERVYTSYAPDLDLIIRPSGELRLSNFLLWQSAYAEFWFDDITWPDFTEKDMERAIISYQSRNRRFGKL